MIKRKGITFLALMITVVIVIMLVSSAIGMANNSANNARITNFTEELSLIEQQVRLFYIENRSLPISGDLMTLEAMMESVEQEKSQTMRDEITVNQDQSATGFYKLDLRRLDISRLSNDGEYIVAIPSLRVYYTDGITANGKMYFSLSSKINNNYSIINDEFTEDLTTDIYVSENLNINRKLTGWTNKLGITVSAYMENLEKLCVAFNGKEVILETEPDKLNVVNIDDLLELNTVGGIEFFESDVEALVLASSSEKNIEIIKRNGSNNVVSRVKIELNNLDVEKPYIADVSNVNIISKENSNVIEFSAFDELSGVKEIRYEYYKTFDRNDGNNGEIFYYSGITIDSDYLEYAGKIAAVNTSGKASFEIPNGVSKIKVVVVDNALNVSEVYEIETVPSKAIFYSISSITNEKLNIAFYGQNITSGTVQYSVDKVKYSEKIDWNAETSIDINNIKGFKDKLYLKAISDDTVRVISIKLPSNYSDGTAVRTNSAYNIPYIPEGFVHIEGTVENGFVIQDVTNTGTKYNEFVWVPVDGKKVSYSKNNFGVGDIATFQNVMLDNVGAFVETSEKENAIKASVEKYGGFYVARYEAGVDGVSGDNVGVPRSMKNTTPWTDISITNAYSNSNSIYEDRVDIASTLMTASAYDTLMKWLSLSKYNVREYSTYTSMLGNFSGTVDKTGKNEEYVLNNIYDICGNVAELTTETYKGLPVFRGGSYSSLEKNQIASVRAYNSSSCILPTIGFRPILYIKDSSTEINAIGRERFIFFDGTGEMNAGFIGINPLYTNTIIKKMYSQVWSVTTDKISCGNYSGQGNRTILFTTPINNRGYAKCFVDVEVTAGRTGNYNISGIYLAKGYVESSVNYYEGSGLTNVFRTRMFTNYNSGAPWTISRQVVEIDVSNANGDDFYISLHSCDCDVNIYKIWFE